MGQLGFGHHYADRRYLYSVLAVGGTDAYFIDVLAFFVDAQIDLKAGGGIHSGRIVYDPLVLIELFLAEDTVHFFGVLRAGEIKGSGITRFVAEHQRNKGHGKRNHDRSQANKCYKQRL